MMADLGHPMRNPDWPRAEKLMLNGDMIAMLLDAVALWHPASIEAAQARMSKFRDTEGKA